MTAKQKLILFLIGSEFANNSYKLVKQMDRADFPAKLGESLQLLLDKGLISVSGLANNGTPLIYAITENGKAYLKKNNIHKEIIEYIKTMQNPSFLLKITEALIEKENNLQT